MGNLTRLAALAFLLAACATGPSRPQVSIPAEIPLPAEEPAVELRVSEVGRPGFNRLPGHADVSPSAGLLDSWPAGWVSDPKTSRLFGLSDRFWTTNRLAWLESLKPGTPARSALRLQQIFLSAGSSEEALRSAWQLAETYSAAQLREQARAWYDTAAQLSSSPFIQLERTWDQAFRLNDWNGARALWPVGAVFSDPDRVRKARLLRQRLFSGNLSLTRVGADDFLSSQTLDRDDLWAATWNGAVVRWSMTTGQLDLMLPAGAVAPVKFLTATNWFLYAFQDQSLLRYSKVTGTWRAFPYPPGWTGLRVQGVVAEGEDSLVVAALGPGLWRWEKGAWSLIDDGGGGPFLNALVPDGVGGFWIGTKDRGLWHWKAGIWNAAGVSAGSGPVNISVIEPGPGKWFVGTWGEGTWVLEDGVLIPWSVVPDYVTAAVWTGSGPLWAALDVGLVQGRGADRSVMGVLDGVPGSISTLVNWEGRWIWGTTGQGWGWWSEYENPAVFR